VDDDVVSALEAAIADVGMLLVQMDKFRAGETGDARRLRAAVLTIGDRARRAHRHGALDGALARELDADVAAARASLVDWLARVRASGDYRRAVDALARGDRVTLRATLPALFAAVRAVDAPPVLFHSVDWQRRGRPRPAADVAREVARLAAEGLPAENDATTLGVDPELPGVVLLTAPPIGAPVHLVLRGDARPAWVLELESGDAVAPGAALRTSFAVGLAEPDTDELDEWTLEPAAYRDELAAAMRAQGLRLA